MEDFEQRNDIIYFPLNKISLDALLKESKGEQREQQGDCLGDIAIIWAKRDVLESGWK